LLFISLIAWMLYGLYDQDYTLVFGNILGLLFGLAYTLLSIPLATEPQQTHMVCALFNSKVSAIFFLFLITFSSITLTTFLDNELPIVIAGILAVVLFYASPIMKIRRVVRSRNAASIHLPLAVMSVVNSVCVCYLFSLINLVGSIWIRSSKRLDLGSYNASAHFIHNQSWMSADSSREEW
jgi:hypothetical protein